MNKYFEFNGPFKKLLPLWIILVGFTILIGASYAYFRPSLKNTTTYQKQVENLQVTYQAQSEFLSLTKTKRISDKRALIEGKDLIFTVKNTSNKRTNYDIYIDEIVDKIEFASVIKYAFKLNNEDYSDIKVLSQDNYIVQQAILDANEYVTYHLKIWLSDAANDSYIDKTFNAKIVIKTKEE